MTVTPLIGITGRRRQGGDLALMLPFQGELDIDVYFASYGRQVAAVGGIPVLIPRDGGPEVVSRLDGLVLSGGADIDPALYAPDEDPSLSKVEPGRDSHELAILDAAAEHGTPVLGICRGIQVLNVHAGGTLCQHVPDHANFAGSGEDRPHQVRFEAGSVPEALYGPQIDVNSLHHQTLARLGEGVRAVGWSTGSGATKGVVEAIEAEGDRVLRALADRLRDRLRKQDMAARWGGDEFVVLLSPCDPETLGHIARRIRESVEQESRKTGTAVTVSVGGYFALPGDNSDTILRHADRALYQAKHEGRNRVCITVSEDPEINPA